MARHHRHWPGVAGMGVRQNVARRARIVWCADTFEQQGRCEQSHFRPTSDLERLLAKLREHQLVGVLNLQNVTGLDESDALGRMVDYLLDPKIADLLKKNQDLLIVNVANEWYGTWDKSTAYYEAYEGAIKRLRDGGLENVLMIDARGYGQDVVSIIEDGPKLLQVDSNLLFSAHMYDLFKTDELVEDAVAAIRSKALPFIVGEFACDHGDRGPVACQKIMQEACSDGAGFGYIGWSWAGNSSDIATLDVVSPDDWQTLSKWGEVLVNSPHGVKAQAKEASIMPQPSGSP